MTSPSAFSGDTSLCERANTLAVQPFLPGLTITTVASIILSWGQSSRQQFAARGPRRYAGTDDQRASRKNGFANAPQNGSNLLSAYELDIPSASPKKCAVSLYAPGAQRGHA